MDVTPNQRNMAVVGLVAVSLMLYSYNRKPNGGPFRENNVYENISPLKHDMVKGIIVDIFVTLLTDPSSLTKIDSIFSPGLGRILASGMSYMLFYEVVQPHVLNKMPYW